MEHLVQGFHALMDLEVLLMLVLGTLLGTVVGAIPGLTTNMAIAIMVPLTFSMDTIPALAFLSAIYVGGMFGGSIAAILLGIPGTGAAVATRLDGAPMARRGRAGEAVAVAIASSVVGGVFSTLALWFLAPPLAEQALKFGPPEYFALAIFGLSTVAGLGENHDVLKGLVAGAFGLLAAVVGMTPVTGYPRFSFGLVELMDGFPLVPVLIGLFGVGSVLETAVRVAKGEKPELVRVDRIRLGQGAVKKLARVWAKASPIGVLVGMIPGPGALAASFMAYDQVARGAKNRDEFGKGIPEGVAATEAANNAVVGGSLVPLLALGVPGNGVSALFLGALLIHGLRPGPSLFRETPEIAYGTLVSMFLANLLLVPAGVAVGKGFSFFLRIPATVVSAVITVFCIIGAFALNNSMGDVYIMLGFGAVRYLMGKFDIPLSPFILGLILAPIAEFSLHQSLTLYDGSWRFLVTRPITAVMMTLAVWTLSASIIRGVRRQAAPSASEGTAG